MGAMELEVGSATASEVEMALATVSAEIVSVLADLRQSRCWLLLVVLAQVWEAQASGAPVLEALVLEALVLEVLVSEVPVLEARAASAVAKIATASEVQDSAVQASEARGSETAMASPATEVSAVWEVSVEYPAQQQSQSWLRPMVHLVPDLVRVLATGSVDRALETTAMAWADRVPELVTAKAAWAAATASDQAVQAVRAA